ncbi:hypothetical protein HIZ25_005240 [Escherichia coli]|nr:hypothetical protein [Escherichia coli]
MKHSPGNPGRFIQCVVRPLQILRADGRWENIGGMK